MRAAIAAEAAARTSRGQRVALREAARAHRDAWRSRSAGPVGGGGRSARGACGDVSKCGRVAGADAAPRDAYNCALRSEVPSMNHNHQIYRDAASRS